MTDKSEMIKKELDNVMNNLKNKSYLVIIDNVSCAEFSPTVKTFMITGSQREGKYFNCIEGSYLCYEEDIVYRVNSNIVSRTCLLENLENKDVFVVTHKTFVLIEHMLCELMFNHKNIDELYEVLFVLNDLNKY